MSVLIAYIATALTGMALVCSGVFILAGPGWALISAGASLLTCAAFIRRGMTGG